MGRNQHSKDRLYITQTEHKYLYGGRAEKFEQIRQQVPFDHCALTFRPWKNPVCTSDGSVYDLMSIVPYIKKYKKLPNGKKTSLKDLKKLHYAQNRDEKLHCPITMKIFTKHSHIVANRKSGNVYSHEAVKELNMKAKNWTDLISGEPFKSSDLVTLQDPQEARKHVIVDCAKVAAAINGSKPQAPSDADKAERAKVRANAATKRVFELMDKKKKGKRAKKGMAVPERPRSQFTSGACSMSFTSSAMTPATRNERAFATPEELAEKRYERVRKLGKKGYVRMRTTHGDLNIELHCNICPRTCDNFMQLVRRGYYDNIAFHRLIRNFMLQGGDPTGTGTGGESCWGKPFKDEFNSKLTHDGRGVISMANSGKDTNGSQFFIAFKSCHHLDNAHSVFGRVAGGLDVLRTLELLDVDDKDRPKERVAIMGCTIFVDPFEEADKLLQKQAAKEARGDNTVKKVGGKWEVHAFNAYGARDAPAIPKSLVESRKIGKYIAAATKNKKRRPPQNASASSSASSVPAQFLDPAAYRASKKPKKTSFKDFSGW